MSFVEELRMSAGYDGFEVRPSALRGIRGFRFEPLDSLDWWRRDQERPRALVLRVSEKRTPSWRIARTTVRKMLAANPPPHLILVRADGGSALIDAGRLKVLCRVCSRRDKKPTVLIKDRDVVDDFMFSTASELWDAIKPEQPRRDAFGWRLPGSFGSRHGG